MTRWLLAATVWTASFSSPRRGRRTPDHGERHSLAARRDLIGLYDSAESFDRAIGLSDKEGF